MVLNTGRSIVILLIILSPVCQCRTAKTVSQGIEGKVLWFEGNLMPGPDRGNIPGIPISREIYFYTPTYLSQCNRSQGVFYDNIRTRLVRKVVSSDDGSFHVSLEPGQYSVFVLDPNGYYARKFDGKGIINPVTVSKGKVTGIILRIDYEAVY